MHGVNPWGFAIHLPRLQSCLNRIKMFLDRPADYSHWAPHGLNTDSCEMCPWVRRSTHTRTHTHAHSLSLPLSLACTHAHAHAHVHTRTRVSTSRSAPPVSTRANTHAHNSFLFCLARNAVVVPQFCIRFNLQVIKTTHCGLRIRHSSVFSRACWCGWLPLAARGAPIFRFWSAVPAVPVPGAQKHAAARVYDTPCASCTCRRCPRTRTSAGCWGCSWR